MDMQTKRRYIDLLQHLVKFKFMTWDINAYYTNEREKAREYVPLLNELAKSVANMAYNYGIYLKNDEEPLYDTDDDFMSSWNSLYARLSEIPNGYSAVNSPFAGYLSDMMSQLESGAPFKVARIIGGLRGNFYIRTQKVFKYNQGGLTDSRLPSLIRLVKSIILHPSSFRIKDPSDNVIINGNLLPTSYIVWFFEQCYTFSENGSYWDITPPYFYPPQVPPRSEDDFYPTPDIIDNNGNEEYEIIY